MRPSGGQGRTPRGAAGGCLPVELEYFTRSAVDTCPMPGGLTVLWRCGKVLHHRVGDRVLSRTVGVAVVVKDYRLVAQHVREVLRRSVLCVAVCSRQGRNEPLAEGVPTFE